jgi:hypothetical protein
LKSCVRLPALAGLLRIAALPGVWLCCGLLSNAAVATAAEGFGEFTRSIGARKFDEQCFRLRAGEAARWMFDTTGAVEFNLHWHKGSDVHYPVRRSRVRRDAGRFVAPHADDYCLMWENKGEQPVELRGAVRRE